jgi:hypothetical protein
MRMFGRLQFPERREKNLLHGVQQEKELWYTTKRMLFGVSK